MSEQEPAHGRLPGEIPNILGSRVPNEVSPLGGMMRAGGLMDKEIDTGGVGAQVLTGLCITAEEDTAAIQLKQIAAGGDGMANREPGQVAGHDRNPLAILKRSLVQAGTEPLLDTGKRDVKERPQLGQDRFGRIDGNLAISLQGREQQSR